MDKRSRVYYTKAQTQLGLFTDGGEWMFIDGTEYKGQYHKYTTGEVFTESNFVEGKSKKLVPYIDLEVSTDSDPIFDINPSEKFEYDNIKQIDVPASRIPNPSESIKSQQDINRGYMIRYFATKVNEDRLTELSQENYGKVGSPDGLDGKLWEKFELKWKDLGPINDVIDSNGNVTQPGIIETNERTVQIKSQQYPELLNYITDFREFAEI